MHCVQPYWLDTLEKLKKKDYDVILMDVQMPVMDGFETTVAIRNSFNAPKSETPIVALTANAIKGDNEKCIELGMNAYLSKPFVPEDLYKIISTYFNEENPRSKVEVEEQPVVRANGEITDLGYLKSISNDDNSFIREMIETFLDATPGSLVKMQESLQSGDLNTVGMIAHKIKPSLTFMGIDELKDKVLEIETLGKESREPEKLKVMVPEFIEVINKAITELQQKLLKVY